jgi:hypothetical protein
MTSANARTTANLVLASAGLAAAYVIITTPSLRRLAMQATRMWLGASVSGYLLEETRRAWAESRRT